MLHIFYVYVLNVYDSKYISYALKHNLQTKKNERKTFHFSFSFPSGKAPKMISIAATVMPNQK